jgi:5'-nucleotidase
MAKPTLADKLVVAISSRALFDLAESHRVYTEAGVDAYHRYQVRARGRLFWSSDFALVKLLGVNRAASGTSR